MILLRKVVLAFGIVASVAIAGYLLVFGVLVHLPPHFDRKTMEAVVTKIRASGLQPGSEAEFEMGNLSDPNSLRPWRPDGEGQMVKEGHVWVQLSTEGHLKIVILTGNLGHFGSAGLAYSDVPLSPSSWEEGFWLDVPGPVSNTGPDMKIDEHWWGVYNNDD